MAFFPSQSGALEMVLASLRSIAPDTYAHMKASGSLHSFAAQYGGFMREEMVERWEVPTGHQGETLPERLRAEADAVNLAVYTVIEEFLNAETLLVEAWGWAEHSAIATTGEEDDHAGS